MPEYPSGDLGCLRGGKPYLRLLSSCSLRIPLISRRSRIHSGNRTCAARVLPEEDGCRPPERRLVPFQFRSCPASDKSLKLFPRRTDCSVRTTDSLPETHHSQSSPTLVSAFRWSQGIPSWLSRLHGRGQTHSSVRSCVSSPPCMVSIAQLRFHRSRDSTSRAFQVSCAFFKTFSMKKLECL